MIDVQVGPNFRFVIFVMALLITAGLPILIGMEKIVNAGSEISETRYAHLSSYLNSVPVSYSPSIQPIPPPAHLEAVLFHLNSSDVFAVNNPATLNVFMSVRNATEVKTINVVIVPAEVNTGGLSGDDLAFLVADRLNAQQGINFRNISAIMGRTVTANFTQDGSFKFVVVVSLGNFILESPLETGSFVVYPYTAKLQAISNQVSTRAILGQTRSADIVEGLAWIVLGLTALQSFFLIVQMGWIRSHQPRRATEDSSLTLSKENHMTSEKERITEVQTSRTDNTLDDLANEINVLEKRRQEDIGWLRHNGYWPQAVVNFPIGSEDAKRYEKYQSLNGEIDKLRQVYMSRSLTSIGSSSRRLEELTTKLNDSSKAQSESSLRLENSSRRLELLTGAVLILTAVLAVFGSSAYFLGALKEAGYSGQQALVLTIIGTMIVIALLTGSFWLLARRHQGRKTARIQTTQE